LRRGIEFHVYGFIDKSIRVKMVLGKREASELTLQWIGCERRVVNKQMKHWRKDHPEGGNF
jgi:hypothetical protein